MILGVGVTDKPKRKRVIQDPDRKTTLELAPAVRQYRPDVTPAVANVIWSRLKLEQAGHDVWVRPLKPAPGSIPIPGSGIRTTASSVPHATPRWVVVKKAVALYAYATRSESRLNAELRVILLQTAYQDALGNTDATGRREFILALKLAAIERPFLRDTTQATGWRRNWRDEHLTERAADLLLRIALRADVEVITPSVEKALLTDSDAPGA